MAALTRLVQSCTTTARLATTSNTKQMQLGLDHRSAALTHKGERIFPNILAGYQPLESVALVDSRIDHGFTWCAVFCATQILCVPIGQDVVMRLCLFHASDTADVLTGCQNLPRAQV